MSAKRSRDSLGFGSLGFALSTRRSGNGDVSHLNGFPKSQEKTLWRLTCSSRPVSYLKEAACTSEGGLLRRGPLSNGWPPLLQDWHRRGQFVLIGPWQRARASASVGNPATSYRPPSPLLVSERKPCRTSDLRG